ncbi:MAG: hypothetical protein PVH88_04030 [Ignavibacteria bacterium]|jgi:hypothetical protein
MQKIKILIVLLTLNLSLLLGNIIVEYVSKEKTTRLQKTSNIEIESLLLKELLENGIKKDWIKQKKSKRENEFYNVTVPRDLSITSLLRNLNQTLQGNDLKFSTVEFEENGKTKFEIFENNKRKTLYYFFYDDSLKRESSSISFLINIADNEELSDRFYNAVVPLTFLIRPSENSDSLLTKISNSSYNYFVLLDDNIEEEKYCLDLTFSKIRLKAVIEDICKSFGECSLFVLDRNSKLARSSVFNFIENEFRKRRKKIIYLDEFKKITGSEIIIKSEFNYYVNNRSRQHKILMTTDVFNALKNDIQKSLKRGDRYFSMKEIIN